MSEDLRIDAYGRCPECGTEWAYEVLGERYTRLSGRIQNDRIAEWQCMECGQSWPRNGVRFDL